MLWKEMHQSISTIIAYEYTFRAPHIRLSCLILDFSFHTGGDEGFQIFSPHTYGPSQVNCRDFPSSNQPEGKGPADIENMSHIFSPQQTGITLPLKRYCVLVSAHRTPPQWLSPCRNRILFNTISVIFFSIFIFADPPWIYFQRPKGSIHPGQA